MNFLSYVNRDLAGLIKKYFKNKDDDIEWCENYYCVLHISKQLTRYTSKSLQAKCQNINILIHAIQSKQYVPDEFDYLFKHACYAGYLDIAKYMIDICNTDFFKKSGIWAGSGLGYNRILTLNDGIYWSCRYGHLEIVKLILAYQPCFSVFQKALCEADYFERVDIVKMIEEEQRKYPDLRNINIR